MLWFVIGLLVWSVAAWLAAKWLIVFHPLDHADAIVMLSGSSTYVERTQHVAELYREGRAPRIVLTNDGGQGSWSDEEGRNPYYFERARNQLLNRGVPLEAISVLPQVVTSTHDESSLLRVYSEQSRLKSLLLVTSSFHSRRAFTDFEKSFKGSNCQLGIDPVAPSGEKFGPGTWWLHWRGWTTIPSEYFKLAYYWLWFR
jgi:uncharacterized SAM-binding protein YcdF (DUF218 family)